MKKSLTISILLFSFILVLVVPVSAEFTNPVIDQDVSYEFGGELTFSLTLDGEEEPESTWLYIQPKGMGIANFEISIQNTGNSAFVITPEHLLLKPFSAVTYWYQLKYADGSEIVTDEKLFYYVDNRVEWQHVGNDHFDLYWQNGSRDFGVSALNVAQQAWEKLEPDYLNAPGSPLIIYLYPSSYALQEAMALGNMPWVAGHADPQLNAMLISIAPGPEQRLEMERQIPHELAHLFTYASLEDGYLNQPRWLLEGLASMAEAEENETYTKVLAEAVTTNTLLPMEDLCYGFPGDNGEVYLAYAQSLSFTRYLKEEYGLDQIQELMSVYGEGLTCTAGFQRAFGISLEQAQVDWQKSTMGTGNLALIWDVLSPYLWLLLVMGGIPLGITLVRRQRKGRVNHE